MCVCMCVLVWSKVELIVIYLATAISKARLFHSVISFPQCPTANYYNTNDNNNNTHH